MKKQSISKRIKEVHLIDEDGNICATLRPEKYFFNIDLKWYQILFIDIKRFFEEVLK